MEEKYLNERMNGIGINQMNRGLVLSFIFINFVSPFDYCLSFVYFPHFSSLSISLCPHFANFSNKMHIFPVRSDGDADDADDSDRFVFDFDRTTNRNAKRMFVDFSLPFAAFAESKIKTLGKKS